MRIPKCLSLGMLFFTFSNSIGWTQESDPDPTNENAEVVPNEEERDEIENEKVEALFESFRNEEYRDHKFPDLDFDDIPALLEVAESERQLKVFPRNMLSSQFESTCREGIVALWLIEGVRKGKKFPSLNSLCLSKRPGNDWTSDSESNHKRALDCYRKWWKDVNGLPIQQAKEVNPIRSAGLHWH